MAKGMFIGVSGAARKTTNAYIGVSGVARKVKSGYVGVNGVARLFFGGEPTITFHVKYGTTTYNYQSGEGMTWAEFIDSNYNDGSFGFGWGNYAEWTSPSGETVELYDDDANKYPYKTDLIVDGRVYSTM